MVTGDISPRNKQSYFTLLILFLPQSWKWKMGPSNNSFLSFGVIFHFHDYWRKGNWFLGPPCTILTPKFTPCNCSDGTGILTHRLVSISTCIWGLSFDTRRYKRFIKDCVICMYIHIYKHIIHKLFGISTYLKFPKTLRSFWGVFSYLLSENTRPVFFDITHRIVTTVVWPAEKRAASAGFMAW